MNLDDADLALLELDLHKLGPLAHAIAQLLIDRIRADQFEVEASQVALDDARDKAKDAQILLGHLRHYPSVKQAPVEVDYKIDEIDELMDEIRELE